MQSKRATIREGGNVTISEMRCICWEQTDQKKRKNTKQIHRTLTDLETLDDAEVGIAQAGVLSNQCNLNGILETIQCEGHIRPLLHIGILHFHLSFQLELTGNNAMDILLEKKQRDVVDITNIVDTDNIGGRDVTEVANLAAGGLLQALSGAAEDDLGRKAEGAQVANTVLGGLGLLLLGQNGDQTHEHEAEVFVSDAELELSEGLEEDAGFDVTDCAADLDKANVGCLSRIVDGNMSHALDPVLNLVGNVRDDLDGLAEVVSLALLGDDLAVNLAGGNVVIGRQFDGQEALVVAKIQVGFGAIGEDKYLVESRVMR